MDFSQKTSVFSALSSFKNSELGKRIVEFLMGTYYPIVVAVLVVIGHVFNLEFYTNIPNFLMVTAALFLCDTIRPAVMFAIAFVYQISVKYGPGLPNFSTYLFTGWRLVILLILGIMLVCGILYFLIANRCFEGFGLRSTPLLIPLILLSSAFLLNGAFSGMWLLSSFLHGACQAVMFTALFLLFYLGLRRDKGSEIVSYFTYASMLTAVILICEVANVYITGGVIVNGEAVKDDILFGWGIWNTAGASLSLLIPMCFLGVMKSKYSAVYFAVATLAYLAAVMTLSRNALLVGGIAYCACAVASCFVGRYKKVYRIVVALGVLAVCAFAVLLWDKISVLLADFLERGFSDNGRYELWKTGIDNFLIAPLFGTGFFQYVSDTFVSANFVPKLAHQTFIQLLSCMGIFGLAAYLYYRVASLVPFVKRPSVDKSMLLASVMVMLCMSLIDNFIFRFLHVIHYSIALAIGFIIYEQQCKKESELKPLN